MNSILIDKIKKYDCAGPRYTSYPPAPVFSPEFGHNEYRESILATEASPGNPDLSLYMHIPFCDTLCYFCGCTTIVTRNSRIFAEYLSHLKREIGLLAPLINSHREVVQMHWGGGTPTYLSPSQIYDLGSYVRENFSFKKDAEVSVEIDPRDLTYFHLKALRDVGFNRISLGVQDFEPRVQHAVNRNQSEFITRQTIDWSRSLGFSSLNLDLIYGLPFQTVESFTATLDKIIDISPDRIAIYNFAYVPWMKKHQKLIHTEDLPSPETKLEILTTTIEKLSEAGYVYIGMDHFAKPDDELTTAQRNRTLHRNFQGYSTNAGSDLYGFGMSAISHLGRYYAQNFKTLGEYYEALQGQHFATRVGYRMTRDDEIRKFVIMRLMCHLYLSKSEVEHEFKIDFGSYFAGSLEKLCPLAEDELVDIAADSIRVTMEGRLFLRNIALCFDAYTAGVQKQRPLYSRTV